MRLRQITEAKFRKSITMYHGTSSVFLQSILSNGLVPDPKKKKWDTDPGVSLGTHSRVSLSGSYWTGNLITATSSARNTTEKFGGNNLIVIAQIQTQSAMADEDKITFSLKWEYDDAFGGNFSENPHMIAATYYDTREYYQKAKDKFIKSVHEKLSDSNEQKPVPEKLLANTFDALSLRIIAHGINDAKGDTYWSPLNRVKNKPDNIPTVSQTEQNLLDLKDKLTRYYRESAIDTQAFSHTLRVTKPVNYRGANRITHIVEIPDGYFKSGEYIQPPIISHYGSTDLPEKFMNDWKTRIGKFPGITKKEKYNEEIQENLKVGYKVMELENNVAISHADKNLKIPLEKNKKFKFKNNGLYLSNNKQFVIDHYTGLTDGDEVLLKFSYDPKSIVLGSDTDFESDFTVSQAQLLDFEKI